MIDLNNPIDAAKATLSLAGNPALLIADLLDRLKGKREWKIYEGSYNGVKFHVFQTASEYSAGLSSIKDKGGRRKAVFEFPYVDGQTTNDLGRKGSSYSVDCVFHGPSYKVGWNALQKELNKSTPGELIHPIIGKITAVPLDWDFTHEAASHQAVIVRIEFTEHNFSIGDPTQLLADPTSKGALGAAIGVLNSLNKAITTVQATLSIARQLRNSIANAIAGISALFQSNLVKMNTTFNPKSTSDTPEAVDISAQGLAGSDANTVNVVATPSSDSTLLNETSVFLTTEQIVEAVKNYRGQVNTLLLQIAANGAENDLYDTVLTLIESVNSLQEVAEKGIKSSRPLVVNYKLPRNMSLREVAYENGLSVEQAAEIDTLNPKLLSVNEVPKGTVLQVPTS